MAQRRRKARKSGKSDHLDAHAVAQLVREDGTTLPQVSADGQTAILDLLVTDREGALAEATRLRNQIHQLLLQIDPEYKVHLPNLKTQAGLGVLTTYTTTSQHALDQQRAAIIGRIAERLHLALTQAKELADQIRTHAQVHYMPLTQLRGVNLLTAGAVAGILEPGKRFLTDAQLAARPGVAPPEASSAGRVRHRLNPGGNRRLNAILYRIALTQAGCYPAAQADLARRQAEGKTRREAILAGMSIQLSAVSLPKAGPKHPPTSTWRVAELGPAARWPQLCYTPQNPSRTARSHEAIDIGASIPLRRRYPPAESGMRHIPYSKNSCPQLGMVSETSSYK